MGGARTFCLGQEPRPARCPQATQLRLHPDRPVPVAGSLRTEAGEAGGSGGRELTPRTHSVSEWRGPWGEVASCSGAPRPARAGAHTVGRGEMPPRPPPRPRRDPRRARCVSLPWPGSARPITCVTSFHSKDAKGRRLLPVPNTATQRHVPGGSLGTLGSSQHGAPVSPLSPPPQVLAVGGGEWGAGGGSQTGSFGWQAHCLWPPAFNTGNGSQKNVIFYLSLKMGNSSHISPNSHLATAGCSTQGLPPTWGPRVPSGQHPALSHPSSPGPQGGVAARTPRERTASPCGRRRKAPVAFS